MVVYGNMDVVVDLAVGISALLLVLLFGLAVDTCLDLHRRVAIVHGITGTLHFRTMSNSSIGEKGHHDV